MSSADRTLGRRRWRPPDREVVWEGSGKGRLCSALEQLEFVSCLQIEW